MSFGAYLIFMFLATIISSSVLGAIVFFVNPFETEKFAFWIFYLSLFLLISLKLATFLH